MSDSELSGTLGKPNLRELVDMLIAARRTGVLRLKDGCQEGRIDFEDGDISEASLDGLSGLKAAYELLSWLKGDYRFSSTEARLPRTILLGSDIIWTEVARQAADRRRIFDGIACVDSRYVIDDLAMLGSRTVLRSDDLQLVDWLDGERPLSHALSLSGLSDEQAAESLGRMRNEGLVKPVVSVDESRPQPAVAAPMTSPLAPEGASETELSEDDLVLLEPAATPHEVSQVAMGGGEHAGDALEIPDGLSLDGEDDLFLDDLLSSVKSAVDAVPDAPEVDSGLVRTAPTVRRRAGGAHPDMLPAAGHRSVSQDATPDDEPKPRQSFWKWVLSFFLWSDEPEEVEGTPKEEALTPEEEAFLAGEMIRVRPAWVDALPAPSLNPQRLREALCEALEADKDVFPTETDIAFVDRLMAECSAEDMNLPIFPDAARKLDHLLRQGEPSISDAVAIVKQEPDMVRRVWKAASHAAYAHKVASLDHAVVRIGLDKLWRIGMSAFLYSPLFRVRGFTDTAERIRNVSIVAAEVASWLSDESTGDTYVAGLLHEVGRLFVIRAAVTRPGEEKPSPEVVEWVADRYYPWLSVLIAQAWGLSAEIQAAVGYHPEPAHAESEQMGLAKMVQVGQIAGHTVVALRRQRDCGGEAALQEIEGVEFDAAATLDRANEILDGLYGAASVA